MEKKHRLRAQRFLSSDLTFELLLCLPSKSLSRFRCVCKSWYALISDPEFGKRHRARFLPNPALLTCSSGDGVYRGKEYHVTFHISLFDSEGTLVREFAKGGPYYHPYVVSICRDLLLFSSFVCNHATQEMVITLPPYYLGLALGYVPSTDQYKVLALELHLRRRYKILTLGTDQWRDVDAPPPCVQLRGAFINGAIHVVRGNKIEIDSFNLEREEWGVLAAPRLNHPNCDLRELSGYLCMLDVVDTNNRMDIWLLKDYNKGLWVKEYTICLSTLKANCYLAVNPLLIEDDGRLLVQVNGYSLQFYDPKTHNFQEIQHFEKIEGGKRFHVKCFSSLGHRYSQSMFMKLAWRLMQVIESSRDNIEGLEKSLVR